MTITFYVEYMSQPCRAVLALLYASKLPFETKEVRLATKDHLKPEFAKINPARQVPALTDGDFALAESHAIMRYLCQAYNLDDHWYPSDIRARAMCDSYLDFHHSFTRRTSAIFRLSLPAVFPAEKGRDIPTELAVLTRVLDLIETYFLKDKNFLILEDKPTIADLSAYCELQQLYVVDYDYSSHKKVQQWMKSMSELEEVKKASQTFFKVATMLKTKFKPKL